MGVCSSTALAKQYKVRTSETGFLNQPPIALRTAVNGLMSQYESEGHRLEEAIDSILERKPRLRKKYKRPDPSTDRPYQGGVTHPLNDDSSCAAVCGDDPLNLSPVMVRRRCRGPQGKGTRRWRSCCSRRALRTNLSLVMVMVRHRCRGPQGTGMRRW
jgi:hypothetical protein